MNFDLTSLHAPAPLWAPTPPPIYHNKVGLRTQHLGTDSSNYK